MAFQAYKTVGSFDTPYYFDAVRSRQAPPYLAPLPYRMFTRTERGCVVQYDTSHGRFRGRYDSSELINLCVYHEAWHTNNPSLSIRNLHAQVHNKALNKVTDELSYVSNLFEAWYERKEAYSLMFTAGKGLFKILTNWNKPKFWKRMIKDGGIKAKQPDTLPEAWLLLQFAIKPLVGTIDDCMNLLLSDFPVFWVEGSSKVDLPVQKWPSQAYSDMYFTGERIVKIGVQVTSLNPNAQLANIMGLTTPVSTFLNVVPWFWAVNYFVNINEVVSNFENRFPGINVGKTYTTLLSKCRCYGQHGPSPYVSEVVNGYYVRPTKPYVYYDGDSVFMERTVSNSVPEYKLERSFPLLGSNQAANLFSAIALTMKGNKK